jgi:hypothetical protein
VLAFGGKEGVLSSTGASEERHINKRCDVDQSSRVVSSLYVAHRI